MTADGPGPGPGPWPARAARWVLSLPIYVKFFFLMEVISLGIPFSAMYAMYSTLARSMYANLEHDAVTEANSLALRLENSLAVNDVFAIREAVDASLGESGTVAYVAVRDSRGALKASASRIRLPAGFIEDFVTPGGTREATRVIKAGEETIVDVVVPILSGEGGALRMGSSDVAVHGMLSRLASSFAWVLVLSLLLGQILAMALSYGVVRPIHHLVGVAEKLREGHLDERARVLHDDETGRLAEALNEMAGGLERSRQEIERRECERLRLVESIVAVQEDERKRISRELHDQFGQSLSSMMLEVAGARRNREIPDELAGSLNAGMERLIDDARNLARTLRPSMLDDRGLPAALDLLVMETRRASGMDIAFQHVGGSKRSEAPTPVDVTLYRIAQEGVTNILKHSGAARAEVILVEEEDFVQLLVHDDGAGFDGTGDDGNGRTGLGLIGMRERTGLAGGTFTLDTMPGRGTTLRVRIPMKERTTAEGATTC